MYLRPPVQKILSADHWVEKLLNEDSCLGNLTDYSLYSADY